MAARLGRVLYWVSNAVALPLLVMAGLMAWSEYRVEVWGHYGTLFTLGGIAIAVWLFGRACRYVLAGK